MNADELVASLDLDLLRRADAALCIDGPRGFVEPAQPGAGVVVDVNGGAHLCCASSSRFNADGSWATVERDCSSCPASRRAAGLGMQPVKFETKSATSDAGLGR